MNRHSVSRRDFLKISALTPFLGIAAGIPAAKAAEVYNVSGVLEDIFSLQPVAQAGLEFGRGQSVFTTQSGNDGGFSTTMDTPVRKGPKWPEGYHVYHNYENPFGGNTKIPFEVGGMTPASVTLFDNLSRTVANYDLGTLHPGHYTINWEPDNLPAGPYFATLKLGSLIYHIKMIKTSQARSGSGLSLENGAMISEREVRPEQLTRALSKAAGPAALQGDIWDVLIDHPDYYDRLDKIRLDPGKENDYDQRLLPMNEEIFNLKLFDEIAMRGYRDIGTRRWTEPPTLFIVDRPPEGYSGYLTPTEEQVNSVVRVWQEVICGAIPFFDKDNISIRNYDIPNRGIFDGGINAGDGFIVLNWSNVIGDRWGAHDEFYNPDAHPRNRPTEADGAVITAASVRLNPEHEPYTPEGTVIVEELIQTTGFPTDPTKHGHKGHLYLPDGQGITPMFQRFARYNYSRPPDTKSPDNSLSRADVQSSG